MRRKYWFCQAFGSFGNRKRRKSLVKQTRPTKFKRTSRRASEHGLKTRWFHWFAELTRFSLAVCRKPWFNQSRFSVGLGIGKCRAPWQNQGCLHTADATIATSRNRAGELDMSQIAARAPAIQEPYQGFRLSHSHTQAKLRTKTLGFWGNVPKTVVKLESAAGFGTGRCWLVWI